jgi:roadblock/LC7 domain-containing protein
MIWGPVISVIGSVLDKVIPDNNAKEKAKADIEKALIDNAAQINLAQAETNKIEANHRSIFVAGWRPCLGWCAAAGFFLVFILQPLAQWVCALLGIDVVLPVFQTDVLMELTLAMLGLAGLRSWEKAKGLTK